MCTDISISMNSIPNVACRIFIIHVIRKTTNEKAAQKNYGRTLSRRQVSAFQKFYTHSISAPGRWRERDSIRAFMIACLQHKKRGLTNEYFNDIPIRKPFIDRFIACASVFSHEKTSEGGLELECCSAAKIHLILSADTLFLTHIHTLTRPCSLHIRTSLAPEAPHCTHTRARHTRKHAFTWE